MRPTLIVLAAALLAGGLSACNSTDSGGPGLSSAFEASNFRRSSDTNGTQTRRDVNRAYTQPSLPSIANRGF
ncbi:hypothetical protein LNAOJCKE_1231 [Methylorubrum aminovorans]|uniref:Lipoprotein n=1 Tax=Methylorubrum aminovorans TaxID=269069 RepID=A0ABQ4UB02_9HYPH|nr:MULTISPECIES: hypothetical protein [Methylobacteriaceae]QIJ74455.1 hypothetical protein CLZ_07595 [Methylobacterium sp. CLZ]QIJ79361.1 hypothetical protein GU700_07595 [Methylobacterium sp. NI91]GJE64032.1 hypothetical protein LNAOJCKE_1231 [Methylorubrum aminovorans]GMA78219.1 hypothetical protein GCM10025880_46360 [Methylorubrum aminovorans]